MLKVENGFRVNYIADQDGDRRITIETSDADMSGWSVEVGLDPKSDRWKGKGQWAQKPSEYDRRTTIEEFVQHHPFIFEASHLWSASVDWGRKIIRWIPPADE
jgi:hypothetical protein